MIAVVTFFQLCDYIKSISYNSYILFLSLSFPLSPSLSLILPSSQMSRSNISKAGTDQSFTPSSFFSFVLKDSHTSTHVHAQLLCYFGTMCTQHNLGFHDEFGTPTVPKRTIFSPRHYTLKTLNTLVNNN